LRLRQNCDSRAWRISASKTWLLQTIQKINNENYLERAQIILPILVCLAICFWVEKFGMLSCLITWTWNRVDR
jgi:hypothetical protein